MIHLTLIFWPVLAQIVLTLALYIKLAQKKSAALKSGLVDETRRALHDDAWPDSVIQVNNCIRNQFELPLLFYVLSIILWAMQAVNFISLTLATCFVISRYVHAYIHTGSNYVPHRKRVFMTGAVIIILMCVYTIYLQLLLAFYDAL